MRVPRRLWFDLGAVVGAAVMMGIGYVVQEAQKKALEDKEEE